jgi:hypothetical protein
MEVRKVDMATCNQKVAEPWDKVGRTHGFSKTAAKKQKNKRARRKARLDPENAPRKDGYSGYLT